MSEALTQFERNFQIVDLLRDMREVDVKFSHDKRFALNSSGLVFIVTAWEAYIEDVVREAADHLAEYTAEFDGLPKPVRKSIVGMLDKDHHELAAGRLAGDGWRTQLQVLASDRTTGNSFNTPKPERVDALFEAVLGLSKVSDKWAWQRTTSEAVAARLLELVVLRGQIVHTGERPDGINKQWLKTYGKHIKKLVEKTDDATRKHCEKFSGTPMA